MHHDVAIIGGSFAGLSADAYTVQLSPPAGFVAGAILVSGPRAWSP